MSGYLVGSAAFKAVGKGDPLAAGSIPVHLRQHVRGALPDNNAIENAMRAYINGARSGNGAAMKPAFHDDATICGYVGPDLFAGPIQWLYDWNDENGPATEVEVRFTSIDVVGTAASVRLDTDNWTGHRFTDFFNLVKIDGEWKIVSKAFYLHP